MNYEKNAQSFAFISSFVLLVSFLKTHNVTVDVTQCYHSVTDLPTSADTFHPFDSPIMTYNYADPRTDPPNENDMKTCCSATVLFGPLFSGYFSTNKLFFNTL